MKKFTKSIPYLQHYQSIVELPIYKDLKNVPNGRLAQRFFKQAEDGEISPADFKKLAATPKFKAIVAAIKHVDQRTIAADLKRFSRCMWRFRKYGSTVPWDLYSKKYHCVGSEEITNENCQHCPFGGEAEILDDILLRAEILSRKGGFFADRLLTAMLLAVPFERIESSPDINLPVAIEILKEFFPKCDDKWIRDIIEENQKIHSGT